MATKELMLRLLTRLGRMVDQQSFSEMDTIVSEYGIELIISDEFIDYCRQMKNASAVIFVSTLAVHNAASAKRPEMILQAYQSIVAKQLSSGIAQLPARHVIRQAVAAIIASTRFETFKGQGNQFVGSGQEWFMAVELCMDHDQIENATHLMRSELRRDKTQVFVLLCSKAVVKRASLLLPMQSASTPWQAWIELQKIIYKEAARLKMAKVAHEIAQLIGEFLHKNRDHEACIEWASKPVPRGCNVVVPLFRVAQAHCHLGRYEQAIPLLDQVAATVAEQTVAEIDAQFHNSDAGGEKAAKMEFNGQHAALALKNLQEVLAQGGIVPFLVSGTLLGFERNGGFLPHDKDIDVGIFAAQDIFAVVDLIAKTPHFRMNRGYLRLGETYQLPVTHKLTGMCIDIFIYYPLNGKLVTGVHGTFGYTQNFAFSPFGLKTVRFLDVEFSVPDEVQRNLAENYGTWQVSDPYYVTHLDSPSTVDQGGTIHLMVARLEILRAIIEGKHRKVARIAEFLRSYQAAEWAMSLQTVDAIDARFGAGRLSDVVLMGSEQPAALAYA